MRKNEDVPIEASIKNGWASVYASNNRKVDAEFCNEAKSWIDLGSLLCFWGGCKNCNQKKTPNQITRETQLENPTSTIECSGIWHRVFCSDGQTYD